MQIPALLRIPQSGEDDCKKGLDRLIANLKTLAPVSGKGQCISKDSDQLAEIETEMVIATPDSPFNANNLFVLEVGAQGEHGAPLTFRMLQPIETITKALTAGDNSFQTDFDPAKLIFTFNNDDDADVTLYPDQVYLDGAPAAPDAGLSKTLSKRQEAVIEFSDVASSWVELGNAYTFGSLASN